MEDKLRSFTKALFAPRLGEPFRVRTASGASIELELCEVSGRPSEEPRPFSLLFRGSDALLLPQGTYRFEHDALGTFDLFIVPVGPGKDGASMLYEAVFN